MTTLHIPPWQCSIHIIIMRIMVMLKNYKYCRFLLPKQQFWFYFRSLHSSCEWNLHVEYSDKRCWQLGQNTNEEKQWCYMQSMGCQWLLCYYNLHGDETSYSRRLGQGYRRRRRRKYQDGSAALCWASHSGCLKEAVLDLKGGGGGFAEDSSRCLILIW